MENIVGKEKTSVVSGQPSAVSGQWSAISLSYSKAVRFSLAYGL